VDLLGRFVPKPVVQALHSGFMGMLAELREVTTAFFKFDGYSAQRHGAPLSLQPYLHACQEILADAGGFIRQFLVDDKGCVLIALWGVPTAAYPDNAARAVTAAGRICTVLGEMGMQVSAGVTTGVVYCGCVGNTVQRAYCAVGDVVNLAARLMGKAHGGILVDEATVSRLPAEIKLAVHKQAPIALKG
jgi:class 3 adenylate cyclase